MHYIPFVLKTSSKILGFLIFSVSFHLSAQGTGVNTVSHKRGVKISNSDAMKSWLAKMPIKFTPVSRESVKVSNIDVKWKQTKLVHQVARARHKARSVASYKCTLNLTITYQDASNDELAPEQIETTAPITVNSRCETFMAQNPVPVDSDFSS